MGLTLKFFVGVFMQTLMLKKQTVSASPRHDLPAGFKTLREQVEILSREFEISGDVTLKFVSVLEEQNTLPLGADLWIAAPKKEVLMQRFFVNAMTYTEKERLAIELALSKVARLAWIDNRFEDDRAALFRCASRTFEALYILSKDQPGNFVLFPVSLGKKYQGRSPEEAQGMFGVSEFGLDVLSVVSMLITHPGYFTLGGGGVHVICSGNETKDTHIVPASRGIPGWSPLCLSGSLSNEGDRSIRFHSTTHDFTHEQYSVMSGFLV